MALYSDRAMSTSYANEYMETMPREKLDELHLKRLKAIIRYAYDNVPMYRDIYGKIGLQPGDIKTLDDYVKLVPVIDKSEVVQYQQSNPPFGEALVRNAEDLVNLFYMTSGTMGKPMMEPGYVINIQQHGWGAMLWSHGIRPKDVFYFAFNFGTFQAFWASYYQAVVMGAQVISAGGLDSRTRVKQIFELQPTVLLATPTYVLHLAEVAREMGLDPARSTIKFIASAGEPGAAVFTIREAMEKAWGAKALDVYGVSELWGSIGWSCPNHPDRLHFSETSSYGIVLDEKGNLVLSGGCGEFVVTSYWSTLFPFIKYKTHDIVEWHLEGCDCGRTWRWLRGGVLGRTDHMIVLKGTNIYPIGIQSTMGSIPGLTEHLEIHILSEDGKDAVVVKIEPHTDVCCDDYDALKVRAEEELRYKIGVRIGVEIVLPKSLPRYETKAKRVIDHRHR